MIARLLTALGLALLVAIAVVRISRPPSPVDASAPGTTFSAERAMRHVRSIAQRPHPLGSVDHDRVRDYITSELAALGISSEIQRATAVGTRYQAAGRVQNIVARLSGRRPGGLAVLLMAHYDGVEAGPAAADDAAGSAAILETLRALRAGAPLTHDLIALFTDGEEAGLLGAAAFVREHPWAKIIGVALNFEARGTSGRSFMFETGPRNLDVARVLRTAPNVSAGSDFTTVYRALPNDTDLSELALLGVPALNFAFTDGVDRYHTTRDDIAHLDPGSLQHHGSQMLALARAFGDGPLPRPRTGDGVFFTMPMVGLIVYPESFALPLAVVAAALVIMGVVRLRTRDQRWLSGVVLGGAAFVASVAVSGGLAYLIGGMLRRVHASLSWGGAPAWSGIHWVGLACVVVVVITAMYVIVRRRATAPGIHAGALVVIALLSVAVAARAPGLSYLFTWPLVAATVPTLVSRRTVGGSRVPAQSILLWVAAFVATSLLAPIAYAIGPVMLGVTGTGGIVAVILLALIGWLLAPLLETLTHGSGWSTPMASAALAIAFFIIGMLTVRTSADHPVPSSLAYVIGADSTQAWLASPATPRPNAWTRSVIGTSTTAPHWVASGLGVRSAIGKSVPRLKVEAPTATVIADSVRGDRRQVTLRVAAPAGTIAITMRLLGAPVLSTTVDGQTVDTTRFRRRFPDWVLEYWAPADTGAVISLSIPAGARPTLELWARSDGMPSLPGVLIRPRPESIVPAQAGDVTVVYRRLPIG